MSSCVSPDRFRTVVDRAGPLVAEGMGFGIRPGRPAPELMGFGNGHVTVVEEVNGGEAGAIAPSSTVQRCGVDSQRERLQRAVSDLDPDEAIVDSWRANRAVDGWASGGRLWLTTRRLVFANHALESTLIRSALVWTCRLADVTGVSVAPRAFRPMSAWRRRLAVHHIGGTDFFVVNRVTNIAGIIRGEQIRALPTAGGDSAGR